MGRPRKKLDFAAALSGRGSSTPAAPKVEAKDKADTFPLGMGRSPLDELLGEEAPEDAFASLQPVESPDVVLQRECMTALQVPGLKPHERLKIILTLDKVNARLAAKAPEGDVTGELRAWIHECLGNGPGPFSD